MFLSEGYFHQIQPCNMHKSVSPYYFRLNITFGGIFLHETTFPNVTLASFKHKNLFASNMLSDFEDIWSRYWLVAENKSDCSKLKTTALLRRRKKLVNKHIFKNRQQCCLKKITSRFCSLFVLWGHHGLSNAFPHLKGGDFFRFFKK